MKLDALNQRIKDKEIRLVWTPDDLDRIVQDAYDPAFGARPIQRYVQRRIEAKLALRLLGKEIQPGEEITVSSIL
jgi:ATP-dependent Clp protease ATP-binding subunit ClpB